MKKYAALGLITLAGVVWLGVHAVPQTEASGTVAVSGKELSVFPAETVSEEPFQFDQPGPIHHYKWEHDNQVDEVWQNTDTGFWRIVQTLPNGEVQMSILRNGILYVTHSQNGVTQAAEQIPQPADYSGKISVYEGMKITESNTMQKVGTSKVNNVPVHVYQKTSGRGGNAESKKVYVDQVSQLPVKSFSTVNGKTATETWTYSKMKNDDTLFALPTGVSFVSLPPADQPKDVKDQGNSSKK